MKLNFKVIISLLFWVLIVSTRTSGQDIKRIPIECIDMIYAPQEDKIYVTTHAYTTPHGSSLCVINPYLGTVDTCYYIQGGPRKMAISEDGNFIYIDAGSAGKVNRFNLQTKAIDMTIELGVQVYARDIKILPGEPNSIVIARGAGASYYGAVVFDGQQRRRDTLSRNIPGPSVLTYIGNGELFGFNNLNTEFGLRKLRVDSLGVYQEQIYMNLITGFGTSIEGQGNRIYSSRGRIVDMSVTPPVLAGNIDLQTNSGASAVQPAPDSNVVYYVTVNSNQYANCQLRSFDKTTFNLLNVYPIPYITGIYDYVSDLISWGGNDKLAFHTGTMVVIIRSCQSAITTPLALSPAITGGCIGDTTLYSAPGNHPMYYWSNGYQGQQIPLTASGVFQVWPADSTGCLGPASNILTSIFTGRPHPPFIAGAQIRDVLPGQVVSLAVDGSYLNSTIEWEHGAVGLSTQVSQPGSYRVRVVSEGGCATRYSPPVWLIPRQDTVPVAPVADVKRILIDNNDMLYVPQEDKIYVTTPGGPANGNSLCVIDPYTGATDTCYFIGSRPHKMALSEDGLYLYVGLRGANRIVRFNMLTKQTEATIPLGSTFGGLNFAHDIACLPGLPNTIAVARATEDGSGKSIALYADDAQLPQTISTDNFITITSNGRMFSGNNTLSEPEIRDLIVTPSGVVAGATYHRFLREFGVLVESQGELIYSSKGQVVNAGMSTPEVLVTYPLRNSGPSAVEPAPDSAVVFFITSPSAGIVTLETHHKTDFHRINSQNITGVTGTLKSLIHWGGSTKLAFNTEKMVVLLRTCTSLIDTVLVLTPAQTGACVGTGISLSAPEGHSAYFWSNGASGREITVHTPGAYTVRVTDTLGCQGPSSSPITVAFDAVPAAPTIAGNQTPQVCRGQVVTLRATGSTGAYRWSTGAMSDSIHVTESGQYRVQAVTPNGCAGNYSNPVNVTIFPDTIPVQPAVVPASGTAICQGSSLILSAPQGYDIYAWSNGQSGASITVSQAGSYSVRVGGGTQCLSASSAPVVVSVLPRPPKPVISTDRDRLRSSAPSGNQWFLNGEAIAGATGQFLDVSAGGFYSVQVTIGGCSSPMSDLHNHFYWLPQDIAPWEEPVAYPNPFTDDLTIQFRSEADFSAEVVFYNALGAVVSVQKCHFAGGLSQFHIGHFPAGVYFAVVRSGSGASNAVIKIMKM